MPSPHSRIAAAAAPPHLSGISGSTPSPGQPHLRVNAATGSTPSSLCVNVVVAPPRLSGVSGSVPPSPRSCAAPSSMSSFRLAAMLHEALRGRRRLSSEDAMGSFLGTGDITDHIIKVVRNFHKIDDPSKAGIEFLDGKMF